MLKKKNIAMMTAAAAVATSVMPVFAAVQTNQVDEATMIAEVEKMLNTKYDALSETGEPGTTAATVTGQEYRNSVYKIQSNLTTTGAQALVDVENVEDLEKMIEASKVTGYDLTLTVTDKGHENGAAQIKTKNEFYTPATSAATAVQTNSGVLANVRAHVTTTSSVETNGAIITLLSGKVIEIGNGDLQLDFTKPVDAQGEVIDNAKLLDIETARQVVGFKNVENTTATYKDIASKIVGKMEFNAIATNKEVQASDLYNAKTGYTSKGTKFLKDMNVVKTTKGDFVVDGVRYATTNATAYNTLKVVVNPDGGYKFDLTLKAYKFDEQAPKINNVRVSVVGSSEKDLNKILKDMQNTSGANAYVELAGDDRFETAVSISQANFHDKGEDATTGAVAGTQTTTAKSIVLVGENAIVDGLAAAPLAAQKDAPILLTKQGEVPAVVMNEIKRTVGKNANIYLVGGTNTIGTDVEDQLKKAVNANIIRLDGSDRFETSLKIAEQLNLGTATGQTAYVVGGTGLADAMSVASFAANATTQAPIIVTPKEGLTKDAKAYVKNTAQIGDVVAIGGEAHISTDVLKDAVAARKTNKVNTVRIAGKDRNDTNAKVIKELTKSSTLSTLYVAKDGDAQLVDALAAAPFAGRTNGAIILATNDLTDAQVEIAQTKAQTTTKGTLVQTGGGIAQTVVEKLLSAMGINVARKR